MNTMKKIGRSSRRIRLLACAAIVGMVATGCATHDGDVSAGADGKCTVPFGANTELTGELQIYGVPAAEGIKAAERDINAAGGVKVGGEDCEFRAVVVDNKSDPAQVVSSAQKVIDGSAVAALAPSLNDTAAYDAFEKAGVITFSTGGQVSSRLETEPDQVPKAVGLIPFQGLQHESYLKQALAFAPDIRKIAIMWPAHQGGQQIRDQFVAAAENVGLEIVGDVGYPPGTADFSTFITKAKENVPDLLITEYSPDESMAIMQQAVPLNAAKYYMSETATAEKVQSTKGLGNATVLLPTFAPTYSAAMTLPGDNPQEIFGAGPAPAVPGASIVLYYASWLTKQAVEKAGTTDGDKVFEALKGQSYTGPFGTCSINEQVFMQCKTAFVVVQGTKVTAQEFADPYADRPIGTYDCIDGKCSPVVP